MKKFIIIHPFLFALFNILFLISHNIEQVSKYDYILPSAITLGFTLLLVLFSFAIFKNYNKVSIIISLSIVLFFSYGRIFDLIANEYIGTIEIGRHRYLLFVWGLLFTSITYLTIRAQSDLKNLTSILNITALSLVVIPLFNIGAYQLKINNIQQYDSERLNCLELKSTDLKNVSELRDIYYIILDGYANSSTLKDVFNYDNQNFIDYLVKKEFYIASESHSNYPTTFLSLASSLNLKYINHLTDILGVDGTDLTLPHQMLKNNEVINVLKLLGYKFIHFSSGWGPTNHNMFADINYRSGKSTEFLMVLIQTTMLRPFEGPVRQDLRKIRTYTFSKLANIHNMNGPKFVFAHIELPHPPYLFGKNGEPVPGTELKMGGSAWAHKNDYVNQLIYTNKQIETIISEILTKSKIQPIIIIQADHGPAATFPNGISGWHVPELPTEVMLRERFGIFSAYYLPEGGSDLLYESITPVNNFRLIFDYYFNTNCGLLKDESYYSNYDRPYEFYNVTDKLKNYK